MIFHRVDVPQFVYPFLFLRASGLFLCIHYCRMCCCKNRITHHFLICKFDFLWITFSSEEQLGDITNQEEFFFFNTTFSLKIPVNHTYFKALTTVLKFCRNCVLQKHTDKFQSFNQQNICIFISRKKCLHIIFDWKHIREKYGKSK